MLTEQNTRLEIVGTILCDAALATQVSHDWFEPDYWSQRHALHEQTGGRGKVTIIDTPQGEGVLKHYYRGGAMAGLLKDRYVWQGVERTRAFAELRLLIELADLGLPVPRGIAARYLRRGLFYRADLITQRILGVQTLAHYLNAENIDAVLAEQVGDLIARFHRAGIWHADLNAHNILVSPDSLYLIDFDRSRRRTLAAYWRNANLMRLRRSFHKLGAAGLTTKVFDTKVWQPLMHRYRHSFSL